MHIHKHCKIMTPSGAKPAVDRVYPAIFIATCSYQIAAKKKKKRSKCIFPGFGGPESAGGILAAPWNVCHLPYADAEGLRWV